MSPETSAPAALYETCGHVAIVTLNRPNALNAVNSELSTAAGEALENADRDPEVRVIVITGAGRGFCAGADLKELAKGNRIETPGHPEWGFAGIVRHWVNKPTIAAVNGFALGGGTEIVLSCDLAVIDETASLGLPEVRRGLLAAAGGVIRLPRQIGLKSALEIALTGEPISAWTAKELRMVNRVAPRGEALTVALELAETIAANAPISVQQSKRVIHETASGSDWDDAVWAISSDAARTVFRSRDSKEGPKAFAEKRTPVWRGNDLRRRCCNRRPRDHRTRQGVREVIDGAGRRRRALGVSDAGLQLSDLDGLLVSGGVKKDIDVNVGGVLNLRHLNLLAQVNAHGSTAGAMVQQAALAIAAGTATTVACVFADTPLRPKSSAGSAWGSPNRRTTGLSGLSGWQVASGATNPNILYALCARRHMETYGTTSQQLGSIAVAQRTWAEGNPLAAMRTPMTLADHQESRWIADPLHLLDCCLVSNGAIAVIVTSAARAAELTQPAVHVWGFGQAHQPRQMRAGSDWGLVTPPPAPDPPPWRWPG